MIILIGNNTLLFIAIAGLHVYWAIGGKWASKAVLPEKEGGNLLFLPGARVTLLVAIGLVFFAAITLGNYGLFDGLVNRKYIRYATLGIALVFFIRAMGDFKYVGLARKIKNTPFAANDKRVFTPLCILIAVSSLLIAFLS